MNKHSDNMDAFEQARAEQNSGRYVLQLFVAGMTQRSMQAVQELKKFCRKNLSGQYEITIIDIYKNPEKAREENLVAVPTLIKELPPPLVKFIGDLSNEDVLLKGLGLVDKHSKHDHDNNS